ncbi:MAG: AraC family transcriptional regulator [Terrimicrobiaceae bacterium]
MSQRLKLSSFLGKGEEVHFASVGITNTRCEFVHKHDFQEVFYVRAGRGRHLLNGREYGLHPGVLVLVCADDAHALRALRGERLVIENVAFRCAAWQFVALRHLSAGGDWFPADDEDRRFPLTGERRMAMENAFGVFASGSRSLLVLEAFLTQLLLVLPKRKPGRREPGAPPWLHRACTAIAGEQHFLKGPREFARLAGRSLEHVSRVTRKLWDRSPTEIVNEARIRFAARLLTEDDQPVTNVARRCGFENMSHFYALFRAAQGCSPARYRKRHERIVIP